MDCILRLTSKFENIQRLRCPEEKEESVFRSGPGFVSKATQEGPRPKHRILLANRELLVEMTPTTAS